MHGIQAIQAALKSTATLPGMYLSDLSDADLLVRPVPSANHIAWQLGHLIEAEAHLTKMMVPDAKYPELPKGFGEQHNKEGSKRDTGFLTKAEYLGIFAKAREATIAAVDQLTDADLDKPVTGPMAQHAPTWGVLLLLVSNHTLMHAGQFTVVRRKLAKPVMF
jgi:uncharacterized damage-inducible protein DinB